MLAHRLRRWPNIDPTLVEYLVFAVKVCLDLTPLIGGTLHLDNQWADTLVDILESREVWIIIHVTVHHSN